MPMSKKEIENEERRKAERIRREKLSKEKDQSIRATIFGSGRRLGASRGRNKFPKS